LTSTPKTNNKSETFANVPALMKVTLKKIAQQAGVNVSTISRALTGGYRVHKNTRDEVTKTLNYHPNRLGRGLVAGRSHTIGLLISDIRDPFFAEVARGAEDAAYHASFDMVLCNRISSRRRRESDRCCKRSEKGKMTRHGHDFSLQRSM